MRAFNKKSEAVILKANGVAEDTFVIQYNKKAPHVRLYQKVQRGDKVIHKRVNQFYKVRKAIQCAYVLSNKSEES